MDVVAETNALEQRLRAAGVPVATMLRQAKVNSAQWQRWKGGTQVPLVTTWQRIAEAVDAMAPKGEAA